MAAIPVVISGVLFDKKNRTTQNVTLVGLQTKAGLQIGGGPVIPETPPEVPTDPPGIWEDPGGYNPGSPGSPLPPEAPPGQKPPIEWHVVWTPDTGWVVVGTPTGPHPAPSKR